LLKRDRFQTLTDGFKTNFSRHDSFKIAPAPNSDGLINCLRQPGQLQSQPLKSMRENFQPFINFCAPRQFRLPGQSLRRAAGRRAGAVFFARAETIPS
jgi:hypothetical protein